MCQLENSLRIRYLASKDLIYSSRELRNKFENFNPASNVVLATVFVQRVQTNLVSYS
jgi:hypothetical protein